MVVGYLRQYAYLVPKKVSPNYTQGPGFNPKPEIIIPIRVSEILTIFPLSDGLIIQYRDDSTLTLTFYPIGSDQSGVFLPGGSEDGMEELFWGWVASINKGVPTPTLDEWFQNAVTDSINSLSAVNTFLQIIANHAPGAITTSQITSEKYLRLFRKSPPGYYSEVIPADTVYNGQITQYSLIDPSLQGTYEFLQESGESKALSYSVPANLNMDLAYVYLPGVWDDVKIQVITRSVWIDGEAARLCLEAMTKINFQNIGTAGQGPGVEWTFTYAVGPPATTKLEYEYFLEDGSLQGGTAGVPRLKLRIPSSVSIPPDWESFAYLNDGFGTIITGIVGPNFDNATSGDDIIASSLSSAITNLRNSDENVATWTAPDGFDITNLT